MPKLHELLEQRNAAHERMKAADAKGDDDAFKAAETEWRDLGPKIDRAKAIDSAERAEAGEPIHGDGDPHLHRELRSFSLAKLIAGQIPGCTVDWGREREMQAELAKRAGRPAEGFYVPTEIFEIEKRVITTGSNTNAILPTDFRPDLFTSALTSTTALQALGATVLTGLTGNVDIPREVSAPTVGWVAENSALTASDATFDKLSLTPHHVGALTEMSRNMVMQSSPAIEGLLRQMMARDIALEIDRAAINGSGTGAVPAGILQDEDVPTEAFTTDLFITTANMIAKADLANVAANRGFLATNGVKADAIKLRDGNGRAIPISETFHGEPTQFTNQAPSDLGTGDDEHAVIYGDWKDLLVGVWSQLDILVNPYAETAYSKGNVLVRALATVDFGVRRPASFVIATGVTTGA